MFIDHKVNIPIVSMVDNNKKKQTLVAILFFNKAF